MERSSINIVVDEQLWHISRIGYPERNHAVIAQPLDHHFGWIHLDERSPSGKMLFECRTCGRVSQTPDKVCPAGKTVHLTPYLKVEDFDRDQ